MPDHLVIRLPRDRRSPPALARVGDAAAGHPVEVLAPHAVPEVGEDTRVIAVVPSEQVLHASVRVPVKSAARVLQTVPFALEEHLTEDVADLHFAIGRRQPDGSIPVAVVSVADMEGWQERIERTGLRAKSMYAQSALLHPPGRSVLLLVEGDEVQFSAPGQPPVAAQMEDVPLLLDTLGTPGPAGAAAEAALSLEAVTSGTPADDAAPAAEPGAVDDAAGQADAPAAAGVAGDAASVPTSMTVFASRADLERHRDVLKSLETRLERVDRRELTEGALPLLARQAVQESEAINLLQGRFAPPSPIGVLWARWRVAAVLLVALFVTLVGGKGAQLMRLDAENERLRASIEQVLRETCPEVRAIVDPQQQMRNCVGALATGSPGQQELFLSMLTALAGALGSTPDTRIEQISFLSEKMDLKIMAPSVDAVERIKQLLAGNGGLDLMIEQTRPRPEGVEFQIELSRRPEA